MKLLWMIILILLCLLGMHARAEVVVREVKSGDTLFDIAREYDTSLATLLKLNKGEIRHQDKIYPHQILFIKNDDGKCKRWNKPGSNKCHGKKCDAKKFFIKQLGQNIGVKLFVITKSTEPKMMEITHGMKIDAMMFGNGKASCMVADSRDRKSQPAKTWVLDEGQTRYTALYPLICGNWSIMISKIPVPPIPPEPAATAEPEPPIEPLVVVETTPVPEVPVAIAAPEPEKPATEIKPVPDAPQPMIPRTVKWELAEDPSPLPEIKVVEAAPVPSAPNQSIPEVLKYAPPMDIAARDPQPVPVAPPILVPETVAAKTPTSIEPKPVAPRPAPLPPCDVKTVVIGPPVSIEPKEAEPAPIVVEQIRPEIAPAPSECRTCPNLRPTFIYPALPDGTPIENLKMRRFYQGESNLMATPINQNGESNHVVTTAGGVLTSKDGNSVRFGK